MLALVEIAIIKLFSSSGNLTEIAKHIMVVLPRRKWFCIEFIVWLQFSGPLGSQTVSCLH